MVEAKGWLATNKCLAVVSDNRLIRIHPGRCRSDNPRRAGGNTQSSRLLRRMATVAMPSSTLTTRQMPDEHYSSTSWDYVDNTSGASPTASHASHSYNGRPSMTTPAREQGSSRGSPNTDPSPPPPAAPSKSGSPPPRSSVESFSRSSAVPLKWRESLHTLERSNTISSTVGEPMQIVEPSFDENVLRALCDMDVRIPLNHLLWTLLMPQFTPVRRPFTFRPNQAKHGVLQSMTTVTLCHTQI